MITQIEIDGFKTFKNFRVELAPFQVIVGANGSGKSNLFDALQLLGRLASHNLWEAFQDVRGSAREQFTNVSDKIAMRRMRFAVEMLLDRLMRSEIVHSADLGYTRLRYEVEITHIVKDLGPDQLFVSYESLKSIPRDKDTWALKHHVPATFMPTALPDEETVFIETIPRRSIVVVNKGTRGLVADDHRAGLEFPTRDLRRAVISLVLGPEYLPIAVVREEMCSWKFLRLSPEELRKPGSAQGPRFLSPSGGNLPTLLAHMQLEDAFVLTDISRDMASLITDISKVKVERNSARDEYNIWFETSDHRTFSSVVLSDGTLRLLALIAVKNVVCHNTFRV